MSPLYYCNTGANLSLPYYSNVLPGLLIATLLDALSQKFGISSTKAHLIKQLHLPQLFLAMQHHTGTRFHDNPGMRNDTELLYCYCTAFF